MLSRVKKLGSKLFGDKDEEDGGLRSPPSVTKQVLVASKGSVTTKTSAGLESMDSGSFTKVGTAVHGELTSSPSAKAHHVLPPISHGAVVTPAVVATALAGAAGTGTGGSGRRKSTPAALDMALRTAEGKAAIEELMNNAGAKKQMVFGQYFGGSSGTASSNKAGQQPTSPSSAAAAAGDKSRLGKAGASPVAVAPASSKHAIHSLAEDYELPGTPERPATSQQHAGGGKPTTSTSPKSVVPLSNHSTPTSPTSSTAHPPQHHHGGSAPPLPTSPSGHLQQHASGGDAARPPTTPQKPAPSPAEPAPKQAPVEVPPARPTKILSVMQQLPTGMARKYWSLADYSIMRKMYTGYASTVYQATCKKSLEQVALKVYHMENLCELNHYQVYREIRVHSALSHQHIIQLYCAFQEGNDVVMVQEYAEGGDLYRLLHRNGGRLSERQAVEMVLHPFLLALHYLHTRGIMHRDIKPENVLFTENRVLKLADFGLAIDLTEERAVTRAGTLDYMAPEVLRCPPKNLPQENKNNVNLHYNNSVDAWAVGVFAYELIMGYPPFAGESQLASVDKIIHATPQFAEGSKTTELAKAFIIAALKKHPGDRPTVMEMLHHPWIRTYQRRTSVLMPHQVVRRRSSVQYQAAAAGPLQPQPEGGPLPGAPDNVDNMTPEDIEKMIQRLQMGRNGIA